jgi:hypothetical protein
MNFNQLSTVLESPLYLGDEDTRKTDKSHLVAANNDSELYINKENEITTLKIGTMTVKVYGFNIPYSKEVEYYFTDEKGEIISLYIGERAKRGIITQLVESKAKILKNDSFMGEIYVNFLLPTFSFIMSDINLTQLGFNFWFNNFDKFEDNGYKVYVADTSTKTKKLLTDKRQLKQYYGKDDIKAVMNKKYYEVYRFVVSRF